MDKLTKFYKRNRAWMLLIFMALIIFGVLFIPTLIWPSEVKSIFVEPEEVKKFVSSFGDWSAIIFIAVSIITIMIPVIPNEVVPIVGGIIFGFWQALILSLLARIIGSSINYWLGGRINENIYTKLITDGEESKIKKYTEKIGWQLVFISRFLPSADTDLIAYVAGIAKMKYIKFIMASFFGMLVPVSVTIILGNSLLKNGYLFIALLIFYVIGMLFAPKIANTIHKRQGNL